MYYYLIKTETSKYIFESDEKLESNDFSRRFRVNVYSEDGNPFSDIVSGNDWYSYKFNYNTREMSKPEFAKYLLSRRITYDRVKARIDSEDGLKK